MNPLPNNVKLIELLLVVMILGETCEILGKGFPLGIVDVVTLKTDAADTPPPGAGFVTVMASAATLVNSNDANVAVNRLLPT